MDWKILGTIEPLEAAVISDYEAEAAVEHELVFRRASLLIQGGHARGRKPVGPLHSQLPGESASNSDVLGPSLRMLFCAFSQAT
jgi:hypothetical protein